LLRFCRRGVASSHPYDARPRIIRRIASSGRRGAPPLRRDVILRGGAPRRPRCAHATDVSMATPRGAPAFVSNHPEDCIVWAARGAAPEARCHPQGRRPAPPALRACNRRLEGAPPRGALAFVSNHPEDCIVWGAPRAARRAYGAGIRLHPRWVPGATRSAQKPRTASGVWRCVRSSSGSSASSSRDRE